MKRISFLEVRFFRTETGNEPVREWLKSLPKEDRKLIGVDIKTIQEGWPVGMPLAKKICNGIWEVRTNLENRISRVLFTLSEGKVILLHGFIKKTEKTQSDDLDLAAKRMKQLNRG
ncbi:MAG: type II toxin-antitoxin system RelE/ParE family toxin [Candidatus Omnitrophota bacterium]|jgi:phage-related protein